MLLLLFSSGFSWQKLQLHSNSYSDIIFFCVFLSFVLSIDFGVVSTCFRTKMYRNLCQIHYLFDYHSNVILRYLINTTFALNRVQLF